ncbi:MAG: hypothetical protein JXM68_07750 [Sedimentisphaerales bacterium]|nr:hypothetical protein [Sedimentisphaerales bacterium]
MERTVESELSGETQMREDDSECTMPGETVALIGDAVVVLLCFVASCVVFVVFYYAYKTTASFIMATIASLIACVSVLVWALLIKYFVSILQCLHILIDLQIQTQEKNED